jgi:uncharacterized protein YlxP (DUF503 family)
MHVLILRAELHLPTAQSLKAKRSVLTSIVRHLDQMAGVAAAEVGHQDLWQRTTLGVAAVGGSIAHLGKTMDGVERYVWSRTEVEVVDLSRSWWEEDS